jgi:hypothetical protein
MPKLATVIIHSLRAWPTAGDASHSLRHTTTRYGLSRALLDQNTIGWYNFLMRKVSIHWKDVQQQYFAWLKRRNTGKAWVKALIRKVWEISWDMWDHRNEIRLQFLSPPAAG